MGWKQKTLKETVCFEGATLFSAEHVQVRLSPREPHSGILFKRSDQPLSSAIPATTEYLSPGCRCTKIAKEGSSVQLIEHFMAALRFAEIDNLMIEVSGPEMPIFDGSALPFLEILDKGGIVEQPADKEVFYLDNPVYWSNGEFSLIALPSNEYRISYTLHYPSSPYLRSQYCHVGSEQFRQEIAFCRTFILYQELLPLIEAGILQQTDLSHGVVIDGDRVLNPEGTRCTDEMARHKILDMIGDFSLVGVPFHAHLIAIKTGHEANHAVAKKLRLFLKKQ